MTEIETGNVTRYCKPSYLENGIVQSSAFEKRIERKEKYLSVYLLEFFQKETEIKNVIEVITFMTKKGFNLKPDGSFAVINIQQSKEYIFAEISLEISYQEENLPHCGIFHDADDLLVAELLAECVQNNYLIKEITDSTNE
ncbi:hypothetical protein PN450_03750 [Dolichospermum lemmermannii CS-548]|uniref:hypothetical protein n=1 Tax=Dolichospermum lemmermannii TaxID=54295 RepID=UPI00232BCC71|nr:hypothetical protein [Dolichospermum lemmermannii]MDB9435936.1 hypothetical protein [Dolichospermum lemmermannii CS-548]